MQRVLLIDDDETVGTATKILLETEGFDVVLAENGRAGLSAMEAGGFDLAIVDLFMPGMDGLETTSRLRRINPTLPIVAMSGFMFRGECPPMPQFSTISFAACSRVTSETIPALPPSLVSRLTTSGNTSVNPLSVSRIFLKYCLKSTALLPK